jgi:hypothetical protein
MCTWPQNRNDFSPSAVIILVRAVFGVYFLLIDFGHEMTITRALLWYRTPNRWESKAHPNRYSILSALLLLKSLAAGKES